MGRLINFAQFASEDPILDAPLLDSEFDETSERMETDYERSLLASIQPHPFHPSNRS